LVGAGEDSGAAIAGDASGLASGLCAKAGIADKAPTNRAAVKIETVRFMSFSFSFSVP
jgi:hypothetical protein